jgi:hypothetical protein
LFYLRKLLVNCVPSSPRQKKALYAALASSLESRAGVSPSDLIVSVVANTNADWSFGLGRAQFLEGDL